MFNGRYDDSNESSVLPRCTLAYDDVVILVECRDHVRNFNSKDRPFKYIAVYHPVFGVCSDGMSVKMFETTFKRIK